MTTTGGTGSLVSADGLVMTNHHVGLSALQKLSSKGKDVVKDGFTAEEVEAGEGHDVEVVGVGLDGADHLTDHGVGTMIKSK